MMKHALRSAAVAAAAAPLLFLAPAVAGADPTVTAIGVDDTTAVATYFNDQSEPATCAGILHFFGTPLSWFGLPPTVTVPPGGSASQTMPFISPGIHSLQWSCQVSGRSYGGVYGPVPVGGAAIAIVNGL
jgi:hypothetical protein